MFVPCKFVSENNKVRSVNANDQCLVSRNCKPKILYRSKVGLDFLTTGNRFSCFKAREEQVPEQVSLPAKLQFHSPPNNIHSVHAWVVSS